MAESKLVMVAGTESGVGKTTVTLAFMAALRRRGLVAQGFKVGPDFIDPGYHAMVTGRPSRNLDGWLLTRNYVRALTGRVLSGADVGVIEGVMGLFDGRDGRTEVGSSAEIAKWLDCPVALVVGARGAARSAAAMALGFETFDPGLRMGGVIFNRVAGEQHYAWLREAMAAGCRAPALGYLPWDKALELPERHLGLVTAEEHPLSPALVNALVEAAEEHVELDTVLAMSAPYSARTEQFAPSTEHSPKVRIAVARDRAFCFYYEDNLDLLRQAGAELVFFSPMSDRHLPEGTRGIYLGGGYPELFAEALADNAAMRAAVREAGEAGMPAYAECGGFMYLARAIRDFEGREFPMVGLFPALTDMTRRRLTLGYRQVVVTADCPVGPAGLRTRGHEFHYSEPIGMPPDVPTAYEICDAAGRNRRPEGYRCRQAIGSYVHQHFGANPEVPRRFVEACAQFRC
jgi:cobyrinic acid a,c-diamide synthase